MICNKCKSSDEDRGRPRKGGHDECEVCGRPLCRWAQCTPEDSGLGGYCGNPSHMSEDFCESHRGQTLWVLGD